MDLLGSFLQYLFTDSLPQACHQGWGLESCQARPIYLIGFIPANHVFLAGQEMALQGSLKKLNPQMEKPEPPRFTSIKGWKEAAFVKSICK